MRNIGSMRVANPLEYVQEVDVWCAITDREIIVRGFRALVDLFGDVNAERFITLTIREPQDYTKWRENMYKNESLHSLAERSRAAGERFRKSMDLEPRVMS